MNTATSVSQLHNLFLIDDTQMLTVRMNLRNISKHRQTGGYDLGGGLCGERNDKQFRWECRRVGAYHSCHLASGDGCMNKSHASIPPSPEQEFDKYTTRSCTSARSICWMLHDLCCCGRLLIFESNWSKPPPLCRLEDGLVNARKKFKREGDSEKKQADKDEVEGLESSRLAKEKEENDRSSIEKMQVRKLVRRRGRM